MRVIIDKWSENKVLPIAEINTFQVQRIEAQRLFIKHQIQPFQDKETKAILDKKCDSPEILNIKEDEISNQ